MAKINPSNKKQLSKLFFGYGLHLWLMVFLMNVGLYYVAHYYSHGKTCFTTAQIQSDSRCLYIWSGQVYEKGSRNSPHNGHPCGTDVTSVIPASHMANQAKYLLPNNVGEICTAAPTPVPTKVPVPTSTPTPTKPPAVPTSTPIPTKPPAVQPTNTLAPSPTRAITPQPTITTKPTIFSQAPTAIVAQPTTVTANPTTPQAVATTVPATTQAPTFVPTTAPLVGPGVSFAFTLPGIGQVAGNYLPAHPTKAVTLSLYPASANVADTTIQPEYTINTQAVYDAANSSPTYGMFTIKQADLGTNIAPGSYQIAFKTNQTLRTLIKDTDSATTGTVFQLVQGQIAPLLPQVRNVMIGDLNNDNDIDITDYNLFVDCFGTKVSQPTCAVPMTADFNDDSVIDGIDYILMLESIRSQQPKTLALQPPPSQTYPTAQPTTVQPTAIVMIRSVSPTTTVGTQSKPKVAKLPSPAPTVIAEQKKPGLSLFAAENVISMTKIFSYLAFFLLVGVAILGAFKSRIMNAILHHGAPEHPHSAAKTSPPPSAVPEGKKEVNAVYYLTSAGSGAVEGKYVVKLTDAEGPKAGYMSVLPPQDGYYTVKGYEDEKDDAPTVVIMSTAPAEKPPAAA